ncbi:hypothetical protein N2152v2_002491 [Parachlorella kessleri]
MAAAAEDRTALLNMQGSQRQLQQDQEKEHATGVDGRLSVASGLACRPCAILLCSNMCGCKEGRLLGRRCSGCGVVRYCSRECQLQYWSQHGPARTPLARPRRNMTFEEKGRLAVALSRLPYDKLPVMMDLCKDDPSFAGPQAAGGSLVASALLRCLLLDGVCSGLGSETVCQLSSSLERLRQQAGSQLQQLMQRTVCQPSMLAAFWYSTLEALAALERATPAISTAAWHLAAPATPGTTQPPAWYLRTLPWPLAGQQNTLVLLMGGTLRLLRALQSQHGSSQQLRQSAAWGAVALVGVDEVMCTHGRNTCEEAQVGMEAVALAISALRPLVDALGEQELAAHPAVSWLKEWVVPMLRLYLRPLSVPVDGYLEQTPDFLAVAAGKAEADVRLAAACMQLAAEQQFATGALDVVASIAQSCLEIAKQLATSCQTHWQRQTRQGHPPPEAHQAAAVRLGLSAAKLICAWSRLAMSATPGTSCWGACENLRPAVQAALQSSCKAVLAAFPASQATTPPLLSVMVTMNAVAEPLLSPGHAIPSRPQLCVWLAGLLYMLFSERGSLGLDARVYLTTVAAFKKALDAPSSGLPVCELADMLEQLVHSINDCPNVMLVAQLAKHGCLHKLVACAKSLVDGSAAGPDTRQQKLHLLGSVRAFLVMLGPSLEVTGGTGVTNLPGQTFVGQLRQLENANQTQIRSRRFWERTVERDLLPALLKRAATAEDRLAQLSSPGSRQHQRRQQQYQEARHVKGADGGLSIASAVACRPCANLLCSNVRGCSEGRLRGRRCSGCGVVRYCSRECQEQHWAQHGPTCASLEGPGRRDMSFEEKLQLASQ